MHSLPSNFFDTKDYSIRESFDAYLENIGIVFDIDLCKHERSNLHARIDSFLIDEIMLVDCATIGQHFTRSNSKIANDGLDHILVQFFTEGGTEPLFKNAQACHVGSLIFIDTARPWKALNPNFRNLSLVVPKRIFYKHNINIHSLHGQVIDYQQNPFASLCWDYVKNVRGLVEKIEPIQAPHIMNSLVELVCATIKTHKNKTLEEDFFSAAVSFQVKSFIEQHIQNRELGVEMLLKNFSFSRATLYRIFPSEFGGVIGYIKRRRLQLIYQKLTSDRGVNYNISELAFMYGFESISSFSRSFKKEFEATPKEIIIRSRVAGHEVGSDQLWHHWYRSL